MSVLLIFSLLLLFLETRVTNAQTRNLPREEVDALAEIGLQLGKKDWNFSLNPCGENQKWNTTETKASPLYTNFLTCNCSYPGGVCHVEELYLRGQDLAGVPPPSLAKLPFLRKIDLARNYLSGTIPPEWVSTKLEFMSFDVNRLSGPIPDYLGNMTTLMKMSLEDNLFYGTVPPELGNLTNLIVFVLSGNNLTGMLPLELSRLTKLEELRINRNNFSGTIPNFHTWTNLKELEIVGSGLEGPIPSSISLLKNLENLRISDLNGNGSKFPQLSNMTGLLRLILRSCNLYGNISSDLSKMPMLKLIDLSFNKLEGEIPEDMRSLENLKELYLTSNMLTGRVPDWMTSRESSNIDLSYNNFSESSVPETCQDSLNLYRSYYGSSNSELSKCLRNHRCAKDRYSLYINCGGPSAKIGDTIFEEDKYSGGSSKFRISNANWGTSSTGAFWDTKPTDKDDFYTAKNVSILTVNDTELYTSARLSPLSLTYYARCLANGNYTVTLHFAEIVFRDNSSFQSLGRRLFDVYIQVSTFS
jgi:Leucine-rich repeat (LRR) protein